MGKILLYCILIMLSGILNSKVQSDHGSIFKDAVTQGGIKSSKIRISLTLFLETPIFRKS